MTKAQGAKPGFSERGITGKAAPSEARSGGGVFFGEGVASPHYLGGLGERCELPQRGSRRNPGRPAVFLYFECSGWLLL